MEKKIKNEKIYKTIGETAKELDLIDKKSGNAQTHTIRYWEKQFRQIKPSVKAGGRRYYSAKDIKMLKNIKFLLKEKGLTINGVKKVLNNEKFDVIDVDANLGVYKSKTNSTKFVKSKVKNILKIIKELKNFKNG